MPRRSWEKLGGAWHHVLAQGMAGARQALGATGKGWHVRLSVRGTTKGKLLLRVS